MSQTEEKVVMTKIDGKWYINTPYYCTSCRHYETCKLLSSVQEIGKPWFSDSSSATKLGAICEAYINTAVNELSL